MTTSEWLSILSVSVAIAALTESALTRFVRSRRKSYAAQLDFNHLREEFDKMRSTLEIIESDMRRFDRDLVAVRTLLQVRANPSQNMDSSG